MDEKQINARLLEIRDALRKIGELLTPIAENAAMAIEWKKRQNEQEADTPPEHTFTAQEIYSDLSEKWKALVELTADKQGFHTRTRLENGDFRDFCALMRRYGFDYVKGEGIWRRKPL